MLSDCVWRADHFEAKLWSKWKQLEHFLNVLCPLFEQTVATTHLLISVLFCFLLGMADILFFVVYFFFVVFE